MSNELSFYGTSEVAAVQKSTTSEMVISRQAQEVQAAMVIAKKFPRGERGMEQSHDRLPEKEPC